MANIHVRPGATGANDGTNWTDAFTSIPATLTRGDTIYLADGTYGSYTFNDAESGTTLITIKKATEADHGSETGWDSTYGDGQAEFTEWEITTGYWDFDGQVGGGPGSWKTGHGIKVKATSYPAFGTIYLSSRVDQLSFRHMHIAMPDGARTTTDANATDLIYGAVGTDGNPYTNITFEYCFFDETSRTHILSRYWSNVLVQYCWFFGNRSTAAVHSESQSDHGTDDYEIRWNVWENIEGTGVIVMLDNTADRWKIHGNVVFWTGLADCAGVSNGIFTNRTTGATSNDWEIYNNTFIDHALAEGPINAGNRLWGSGTGNKQKNNVWFNCGSINYETSNNENDYNWFINSTFNSTPGANDVDEPAGGDPFVDKAGENWKLTAESTAGLDVGVAFNTDYLGVVRGNDGTWTRGALEFIAELTSAERVALVMK